MKNLVTFVLFLICQPLLFAQKEDSISRKSITINRIDTAPKIDGVLDDPAWEPASVATGFVERSPNNGKPIPDSLKTDVKIIFDDLGIYFGAIMHDPDPEKIMKELTERDNIGNDDFFFVLLNGYNDRQQSMQFIVTAAGVQYDAKMTNGREDSSWNAVWFSAVQINDTNWIAEIFIPYSELRFPEKAVHEWGLNMEREFRREGIRYSWSPVNNQKGSYSIYDGEIYGIENIQTPVRLSFQPYITSYINSYAGDTEVDINGGMDLKYGINDAFTLDMILIPDFGQTKFDDAILNLSAFEVQYDEQRAFFTEGTELFSKGDLFYSRRVGGPPVGRVTLNENEEAGRIPASVDIINALKISGRTDKGLGVGFFNAITEKTEVDVINTVSGESRKAVIEPFTNYNVTVLDQRFGDNSSVSFVNTNTLREGNFRDANATGLYLNLTNKNNTWNYEASTEGSWVMTENTKFGVEGRVRAGKVSGKNRLNSGINFRTKDYDINDLGYSGQTNYINYSGYYGYRYLQPKGFLNNLFLNFNLNHQRRLEPDLFSNLIFNFNSSFTTRNFFNFGGGFETTPFGSHDIYEPRVEGRYVQVPDYYETWIWFATDYRKNFATEVVTDWYKYNEKGRGSLFSQINATYRISDKLRLNMGTNITSSDKEKGFVNIKEEEIIFGERNRRTIINSLGANYIFNNKIALKLDFRHYYSEVFYSEFYSLENNGELTTVNFQHQNYDATYNSWNLDLRFSWWFAPGSQMTLLYRNNIESYLRESHIDFSRNFNYLFDQPQINNLSLRISYYLDYNRVKNWFGSKPVNHLQDMNTSPEERVSFKNSGRNSLYNFR